MKKIELNGKVIGNIIGIVRVDSNIISSKNFYISNAKDSDYKSFILHYTKRVLKNGKWRNKVYTAVDGYMDDFRSVKDINPPKGKIPSMLQILETHQKYIMFDVCDEGIVLYQSCEYMKWSKCGVLIKDKIGQVCLLPEDLEINMWFSVYGSINYLDYKEGWSIHHAKINKYDLIEAIRKK